MRLDQQPDQKREFSFELWFQIVGEDLAPQKKEEKDDEKVESEVHGFFFDWFDLEYLNEFEVFQD